MQQENKLNLSPCREKFIIAIIIAMYPLFGMAVDLVAPSLPAISHGLNISAGISKDVITLYLLGLALGNFFIGLMADASGRRKIGVMAFLVFTAASLMPAVFPHITVLLFARLLQGLALGGVAICVRTILSDMLSSEKLVRVAPLMATSWGIGPIIGPVIGGYLQYYINWQAGFYFFALYGLAGLLSMIFIIPETYFKCQILNFNQIKTNLMTIVSHKVFMGVIFIMGLNYSALILFNTLGPFLIQSQLGYTSVYFGHVALWMGFVFLLGAMTCRYLVRQYQPEKILFAAIPICLLVSIIWVILAYFYGKNMNVVIIPSLLMFFGCGIIYPAGMGKGLALFRHISGAGSAVMNMVAVLITSLTALVMSFIAASSVLPMACIYLGLMLLSGLIYWLCIKPSESMISEK